MILAIPKREVGSKIDRLVHEKLFSWSPAVRGTDKLLFGVFTHLFWNT